LPSSGAVRFRGLYSGFRARCENLFLDFNSMWHVLILNRYLEHYVTELHDNGSDSASQAVFAEEYYWRLGCPVHLYSTRDVKKSKNKFALTTFYGAFLISRTDRRRCGNRRSEIIPRNLIRPGQINLNLIINPTAS